MLLSKRLLSIAGYVVPGNRVVDVGTDHGYIPIWLVEKGICSHVIASDIKEGPLKKAIENAAKSEVDDSIDFSLSAGLDGCSPDAVDTIIIAGMGGETIIGILNAAPWAKEKTLIIQPQTKIPELRSWMNENGYDITNASLVDDAGRIYVVWQCAAGNTRDIPSYELYVDRRLIEAQDPLLAIYIDSIVKKLRHKAQGMEKAAASREGELERCRAAIDELLRIRKELDNA